MASLLYSSCSILKTCCTHHIIAPYTWNFFPLKVDTLHITWAHMINSLPHTSSQGIIYHTMISRGFEMDRSGAGWSWEGNRWWEKQHCFHERQEAKGSKQDLYMGHSEILYPAIFHTYLSDCKGNSTINFEGNHFISSNKTKTETTRMSAIITLWLSLTQSIRTSSSTIITVPSCCGSQLWASAPNRGCR